ncbi:hypothetical protein BGX27_010009 [Mortierella sp. AM989]|nr:hypothetical protein BGX27_010009 [Mortierella sp. AM989]
MEQGSQSSGNGHPPFASYPQPPMLSFRSFHERHFSRSQQQAFFADAHRLPRNDQMFHWYQGQNGIAPIEAGATADQMYQPCYASYDGQVEVEEDFVSQQPTEPDTENTIATTEPDYLPSVSHLSKEAIEIFEFSRRFRQEKAAAALLEQTRLKKRRTKRRKLTKLGFALDEGDSGSEASTGANEDDSTEGPTGGTKVDERASDGETDGSDDDWDDSSALDQEPSPTDMSFITQRSRRTDKIRQELYGNDVNSAQKTSEISVIEMLESLVNQTYEDSFKSRTPASEEPRKNKHQRAHGEEIQFAGRRNQVVYWPGMPLRC